MALVDIIFNADEAEANMATLSSWMLAVGEQVHEGGPVAEVETDKVSLEVTAPVSGTLVEQCLDAGTELEPGQLLGRISPVDVAAPPADADPVAFDPGEESVIEDTASRHRLSPAVRQMANESDVDLSRVRGTGKGGRIRRSDIVSWLAEQPKEPEVARFVGEVPSRLVPHTSMRRSIARNMAESLLETSPHVTSVFEADLTRVAKHRKAHKADFAERGVNLTYTAYFLSAAAKAMEAVPQVNARFHEDALEIFEDVNIGVGIALGNEGLIVPVVKRVQAMNLEGIAAGLDDTIERARLGRLSTSDLKGGTFTISNHGVSGSLFAAPIIINQPQVAILGIGKLEKRVKVMEVDGEDTLRIRSMCYVTLSIDHRALDAYQTNHWLGVFVDQLHNWPD
jgi:2-oxoglutarate dehydrogenase E2 component (dihydrolipoamide succinyltransferase)